MRLVYFFFWTLMHYAQYKQVALRHQAMLVTRGAHHRFGRVTIIADKEKDNVTIDKNTNRQNQVQLISY